MSRKLSNVTVTHISFVDKAANKRKFFLTKEIEDSNFDTEVKTIVKSDDPEKLVYGVVYEPNIRDAHDDFMSAVDIEKAAHTFMENYQHIDKQHDFETHAGKVVESYLAPVDMTIEDEVITKGTWILVTKATDDIWAAIQKGEFTGYSLAGTAEVTELEDKKDRLIDEFKSFMKSFFYTKKQESKGEEMKPEEMKDLLSEMLSPISKRLETIEKELDEKKDKPEDEKKKDKVKEADGETSDKEKDKKVDDEKDELLKRIEVLEKARHSNVVEVAYKQKDVEKSEALPSYVDAAFPIED
ncbi:XkdF-like putative serine protease domain-containing protein [Vagococcus sp. PNs007]|uniref:XkdF-like putative serine protease domain-containing protein n=1 Tax=Vagococcus proximus TaxID=2991417 RepID=A0ABT5X2P1_9ENTE|nr:XkdF-like putative serine protease domain-containing protein [Vagococcus proximus]MDF0480262.1 XkdF-like putative serine protease domain-containing protein [Vagococcus proximus]